MSNRLLTLKELHDQLAALETQNKEALLRTMKESKRLALGIRA